MKSRIPTVRLASKNIRPIIRELRQSYYQKTKGYNRIYSRQHKDRIKNTVLKRLYGITKQDYDQMVVEQGGACAICRKTATLCVDHDHTTKNVRGLLCHNCNHGLGKFADSTDLLRRALQYLEEQQTRSNS